MSLKGFEKFYFKGTYEQKKELIEIHERNGCPPYSKDSVNNLMVTFEDSLSQGYSATDEDSKPYAEAKAYLLSFAKPVKPVNVAKPKRKKLEITAEYVIEGTKYSNGFIDNKSIESYESHLAEVRQNVKDLTKYLRHYRIAKKRGF